MLPANATQAIAYSEVDFIAARYRPEQLVLAGPGRRLAGHLIDSALLAPGTVVLFWAFWLAIFTFGFSLILVPFGLALLAPWWLWFLIVAPRGQTPGKQLLGMYIIKADGTRAGGGYTWLRELVVKQWLVEIVTFVTFGFFYPLAATWCLWDKNSQCLWDKLASTYIGFSPYGFRPMTAGELMSGGMHAPGPGRGPANLPPVVINNINNNSAQVGNSYSSQHRIMAGRVGVMESGHTLPRLSLAPGEALLVGREVSAQVRLSDPKASRRHLEIRLESSGWVVRDLGATNPAEVLTNGGTERMKPGGQTRLRSGQLRIGEAVITLFPVTGQR